MPAQVRVGARGVVSDRLVVATAQMWRAKALDGVLGGAVAGDGTGAVVFTSGLTGRPEAINRHRPSVLGGVLSVYAGLMRGVGYRQPRPVVGAAGDKYGQFDAAAGLG